MAREKGLSLADLAWRSPAEKGPSRERRMWTEKVDVMLPSGAWRWSSIQGWARYKENLRMLYYWCFKNPWHHIVTSSFQFVIYKTQVASYSQLTPIWPVPATFAIGLSTLAACTTEWKKQSHVFHHGQGHAPGLNLNDYEEKRARAASYKAGYGLFLTARSLSKPGQIPSSYNKVAPPHTLQQSLHVLKTLCTTGQH